MPTQAWGLSAPQPEVQTLVLHQRAGTNFSKPKAGSQKPWDQLRLPDGWHPFQEHMLCSQGRQDWAAPNSEKEAAPGPL